jgi:Ras-related protein Rab-8A
MTRYVSNTFSPHFVTTVGVDFRAKTVQLDGKIIKVQIWDTAGQERFRTITKSHFRHAQGILLVYDVSDRNSFLSIRNWMGQMNTVRIMILFNILSDLIL